MLVLLVVVLLLRTAAHSGIVERNTRNILLHSCVRLLPPPPPLHLHAAWYDQCHRMCLACHVLPDKEWLPRVSAEDAQLIRDHRNGKLSMMTPVFGVGGLSLQVQVQKYVTRWFAKPRVMPGLLLRGALSPRSCSMRSHPCLVFDPRHDGELHRTIRPSGQSQAPVCLIMNPPHASFGVTGCGEDGTVQVLSCCLQAQVWQNIHVQPVKRSFASSSADTYPNVCQALILTLPSRCWLKALRAYTSDARETSNGH